MPSHGPMTPTLANVMMITGLNITTPDIFFSFPAKATHRIESRNIGAWKGYISTYSKSIGSVDSKEHSAFLNMWLEKYILCGKSVGPAINYQKLVEYLAGGNEFPLGKYLLGAVCNLLHQVSVWLRENWPIGNLGGPWWFINLCLDLHMRSILDVSIINQSFLSDQPDDKDVVFRRCSSFGEAASTFFGD